MKTEDGKRREVTRRGFLAGTAATAGAAAAITFLPSHVLGREGKTPPSDKLNIAGIGVGGMGGGNVRACSRSSNIVALCDVDRKYAAGTFKRYPKAKIYTDYRVMLDKQKDIDAVIVGTPDHTHAVITMAAMRAGKHVFCQKPLAHTVREARMIAEAAKRYKVQTQMGNQGHSSDSIRLVREWVQGGALGDVKEVHTWSDRPIGGPWYANFAVRALPKSFPPVPDTLNWDLWLGPAKDRKYHPAYVPFKWRGWLDYGTGALGDMGCHILDPAFWALDLARPTSIKAEVEHFKPELANEVFPISSTLTYEFPARGKLVPMKLIWTDGHFKKKVPPMLEKGRKMPASGAVIYGSKETIMHGSHGAGGMRVIPEARMKTFKRPDKTIGRVRGGHEGDWIRACKDGKAASSNFSYGGALTEMVLLGVIAMRVPGKKLLWDSKNLKFTNSPEANAFVHPEYRKGWTL